MQYKAFKYRLYPTKKQQVLIDEHIGACRFVYNLALETKQIAYAGYQKNLSCFDLMSQLPGLKQENEWLKKINSQSLQQTIVYVDSAYTNFFKGYADFPKYKSKHKSNQSFCILQGIIIKNNKLFVPKFREGIKIVLDRNLTGKIKQATVSKTKTGKYFVSILAEYDIPTIKLPTVKSETTIGIDLGIKDFLTTSNGDKIANPKFLKAKLDRLKFIQRKLSKHKGKKTKRKFVVLHEKIANQRKDFLHKVSKKLISENQTIILETLKVKDMLQNQDLSREISDVSWGMFVSMLEYKSNWYGVNLIKIGQFEPSSKTCSCCGNIKKDLTLNDREWQCIKCHTKHDRDINAAINIKNFGLRNWVSGVDTKNQNELPTLVGVMTSEAKVI